MTREEAVELLKEPLYEKETMQKEIESILRYLDISRVELENFINSPTKTAFRIQDFEIRKEAYDGSHFASIS